MEEEGGGGEGRRRRGKEGKRRQGEGKGEERAQRRPSSNAVRVRMVRDLEGPWSHTQKPRRGFLTTPLAGHCGVPEPQRAPDKGGMKRPSENLVQGWASGSPPNGPSLA